MSGVRGRVTLIVTDQGRQVLELASIRTPETSALLANVVESEDLGVWIRVARDDGEHDFSLRWDYISGVDVPAKTTRPFGLTGRKDLG